MKNYFIIHGSFSGPYANWFPWLAGEIEKMKTDEKEEPICYVPQFPTGVGYQNFDNWEKVLMSYVDAGLINEETIIFAHSIAPIFVCKFLIKHKIKVERLVFVAGFNNYFGLNEDYDNVNGLMYLKTEDLKNIKKCCSDIVAIYSNNDPYVKFDVEKEFADTIATKQIVVDNGGHLNSGSGYSKFDLLLSFLNWGVMESFKKLVKSSSVEVEKGYIVDNYFDESVDIGYSVVQTHLNGKHPVMLNKLSNRTYFLIDGHATFLIDGKTVELKKNEMLVIEKNTKYSFEGEFDAILIDCPKFNPQDDVIFN